MFSYWNGYEVQMNEIILRMHHRFYQRLLQSVLIQFAILVDVHPLVVGAKTSLSFGSSLQHLRVCLV